MDEEFDKLDEEMAAMIKAELEIASQPSFTKVDMANHLEGDDPVTPVLKGHLYLEHVLITAIRDALIFPDEVNVRQLSFPAKANLAVALGQLPRQLKPAAL